MLVSKSGQQIAFDRTEHWKLDLLLIYHQRRCSTARAQSWTRSQPDQWSLHRDMCSSTVQQQTKHHVALHIKWTHTSQRFPPQLLCDVAWKDSVASCVPEEETVWALPNVRERNWQMTKSQILPRMCEVLLILIMNRFFETLEKLTSVFLLSV